MATWIFIVEWIARLILILLVFLSFWSVAIMLGRRKLFKQIKLQDDSEQTRQMLKSGELSKFQQLVSEKSKNEFAIRHQMLAQVLEVSESKSSNQMAKEDRAARSFLTYKKVELENGLTVLATLGSNAPFIGLFGTVLGIIKAFGALSGMSGDGGNSSSVMSGISEALVATAIGLLVAIPAVVAYNYFQKEIKKIITESESLKDLYLSKKAGD